MATPLQSRLSPVIQLDLGSTCRFDCSSMMAWLDTGAAIGDGLSTEALCWVVRWVRSTTVEVKVGGGVVGVATTVKHGVKCYVHV